MSAQTSSISIPSIFRTLSATPRTREHHQAARQLANLDPKKFLSNLQAAAVNRSPQAIAAVKADMTELEDIFHKLARSGHDVSAAQRDFQMLEHFVSQLASSQKQRSHTPLPPPPSSTSSSASRSQAKSTQYQYEGGHRHTSSLPTSLTSSHEQSRSRSGSFSIDKSYPSSHSSTRYQPSLPQSQARSQQPHASHALGPTNYSSVQQGGQGKGFAPGSTSSSSSRSSSSSSRASSSAPSHYSGSHSTSSSAPKIVAPIPINHLIKPRRHSAPASTSASAHANAKHVHFASHATVYTFTSEAPALVPPPRPACIPRVGGSGH